MNSQAISPSPKIRDGQEKRASDRPDMDLGNLGVLLGKGKKGEFVPGFTKEGLCCWQVAEWSCADLKNIYGMDLRRPTILPRWPRDVAECPTSRPFHGTYQGP